MSGFDYRDGRLHAEDVGLDTIADACGPGAKRQRTSF